MNPPQLQGPQHTSSATRRLMQVSRALTASSVAATPAQPVVYVEKPSPSSAAARVVLNRPAKMNALDLPMVDLLTSSLKSLEEAGSSASSPILMLLEGAGPKAFCAGGDVYSIQQELVGAAAPLQPEPLSRAFFYREYKLDCRLGELNQQKKATQVSLWNGITMGGGVGVSLHGAFRVATEKTLFAMPETGIGFFPDVGGTYALPRLSRGPSVGLYLALTGARLGPYDALWTGLATHYVASEKLDALRADLLASKSLAQEEVRALLGKYETPLNKLPVPGETLKRHEAIINECFQLDRPLASTLEALRAHAEQGSAFAVATLAAIRKASPLSVAVTHEALRRNGNPNVTLAQAFELEFRMSQAFCASAQSDFKEGVRAVLVDRDHKPKWNHASLDQIKSIDEFFQPFENPKHELWA